VGNPLRKKITSVSWIALVGCRCLLSHYFPEISVIMLEKLNFVVLSMLSYVLELVSSIYKSKSIDFSV